MNADFQDEYNISTDNSLLDVNMIHQYLSEESYWAKNISRHTVQKSIENSICFGIYRGGDQVGFARVITDKATFAYLADVFILEQYRGKGLSKTLMEFIMIHSGLQGLRRWMLATRDAHDLYKQFNWQEITNPERLMQIHNPDIYL